MKKIMFSLTTCACVAAWGVAVAGGKTAEEVYNSVCAACHSTGVAGAPKVGDKENWSQRAAQGLDTLVSNAIKGKAAMPPKGGNPTLTDDEIKNTIEFMLAQTGVSAN